MPTTPQERRAPPWAAVVAISIAVLLALGAVLAFDGAVFSRGDAATEESPPSERGLVPPTTELDGPEVSESAESSRGETSGTADDAERFQELQCEFQGTATLDPALGIGLPIGGGRHEMGLEPGARFECTEGAEASAGSIGLDATFESLNAFNGVTTGTGSIKWSELAAGDAPPDAPPPVSNTLVEVQLD